MSHEAWGVESPKRPLLQSRSSTSSVMGSACHTVKLPEAFWSFIQALSVSRNWWKFGLLKMSMLILLVDFKACESPQHVINTVQEGRGPRHPCELQQWNWVAKTANFLRSLIPVFCQVHTADHHARWDSLHGRKPTEPRQKGINQFASWYSLEHRPHDFPGV